MNEPISKLRQRTVGQRGRQSKRFRRKMPFKDGVTLAVLYNLIMLVAVVFAIYLARNGFRLVDQWAANLTGILLLSTFSILGMRLLLNLLAPVAMERNSRTCLVALISLISLAATAGIAHFAGTTELLGYAGYYFSPFLYPYIFTPMFVTLLLGHKAGIATGIGTSMLMAQCCDYAEGLLVLLMGLMASIVVPHLVDQRVRKRMQLMRVSQTSALVLTVGVYFYAMMFYDPAVGVARGGEVPPMLLQVAACLAGSFLSAVLLLLLLPLFEHVFAVSSNISLQAFSDLGHPLIERLCQEAPGTYSHVITVATLSSVAADRIGANGLLARVGAYFHDIGKLSTPNFFIENTTPENNPHETLKPNTSASWIRAHVKDGVVLANRYRLPPPVKQILWEHHGTTLMETFLHKAREQAQEERERAAKGGRRIIVEESQFRYQGPRPSTRESAIVMLADSVEAAARSLNKPTPQSIEHLVSNITEAKLKDEQLDDCPLTIRELAMVKQSFVSSLATILHARIPYPSQKETSPPADDSDNNKVQEAAPKA